MISGISGRKNPYQCFRITTNILVSQVLSPSTWRVFQVAINNVTAVFYMNVLGWGLWERCIVQQTYPIALHFADKENIYYWQISWAEILLDQQEVALKNSVVNDIFSLWVYLEIDIFAARPGSNLWRSCSRVGVDNESILNDFLLDGGLDFLFMVFSQFLKGVFLSLTASFILFSYGGTFLALLFLFCFKSGVYISFEPFLWCF